METSKFFKYFKVVNEYPKLSLFILALFIGNGSGFGISELIKEPHVIELPALQECPEVIPQVCPEPKTVIAPKECPKPVSCPPQIIQQDCSALVSSHEERLHLD